MNTENIAPCFCIQSSTQRVLRLSIYKTSRSCILKLLGAIDFSIGLRWNFPDFGFAERSQKTLLYVGHSSLGELWRCEDTQFLEINLCMGLIFFFKPQITLIYFCQQTTSKIRGYPWPSWESIKPTNGLSLNLFNAHKWHQSTRILHALRLCCHPDGSLNIKL